MSRFSALLLLLLASLATCSTDECFLERDEAECCREVLLPGQFFCVPPNIDLVNQTAVGCTKDRLVNVSCFAAPGVDCVCEDKDVTVNYSSSRCVFMKEQSCRFVNGRRYDYRIAVALSLFLGVFGIDRFYLGYPAIGLIKLCTLGFFFIGHLIDFILILVQVVGPADRSDYYVPFYGPALTRVNTTNIYLTTSNATCALP